MSRDQFWLPLILIAVTVSLRLIEHPWNVAPLGAIALFAGAHFRDRRWAFGVPLAALVISDIALGAMHRNFEFWTFHPIMLVSALCYLCSAGLGVAVQSAWKRQEKAESIHRPEKDAARWMRRIGPVAAATLTGTGIFFLVTNFAVWLLFPTYPRTWAGLLECYEMAIPFVRNSMLSDAVYVTILFSAAALLRPLVQPSDEVIGTTHT